MTKKKKWLVVFFLFAAFIYLKPTLVVRTSEDSLAMAPTGTPTAGRGIASVPSATIENLEPSKIAKPVNPKLLKETKRVCETKFQRENCLVSVLKCGNACLNSMKQETKVKIWSELLNLKVSREARDTQ